ncbi:hypothetical protein BD769DRAFT_1471023 [Suillus cothurnatus]|nr:hypothetical protein BD769DRAFT_1471023 [Suillus cothurnatus]
MAHAMLLRALLQTHVYSFTALTPYRWMEQSDCQRWTIFARGPRVVGVATVRLIIQKGMYSEFTFLHGALASLDRNLLGNQSDHGLDRSVLEGRPQGFEGVQIVHRGRGQHSFFTQPYTRGLTPTYLL